MKNRIKNMSEFKYKVGDKVRIKSIDWYNENKDKDGDVPCGEYNFVPYMLVFCEKILTIDVVFEDETYIMKEDTDGFVFTNEMIEGLVEEECNCVTVDGIPNTIPIQYQTSSACFHNGFCGYSDSEGNETSEWNLPEGYQFVDENGNVINATKIVLEKKKEYPKTYEECAKIMNCPIAGPSGWLFNFDANIKDPYYRKIDILMGKFTRLLICRDAYWKIAGENMGLGKPWEPDWDDDEWPDMYYISFDGKHIDKEKGYPCCNMILIFPTEEMRDAFYENFKELIETVKELL